MNGSFERNSALNNNRHMRHTSHLSRNRDLDETSALLLDESHDSSVQQQIRGTVGRRGGSTQTLLASQPNRGQPVGGNQNQLGQIPENMRELSPSEEAREYERIANRNQERRNGNGEAMQQQQLWAHRARQQQQRNNNNNNTNNNNAQNQQNQSFISNNSFGVEMDFLSMWSQVTDEQIKKIQYEFAFDVILMIIVSWILWYCIEYQKGCGIPVKQWLLVFFIMYFSRSSFQMIKILVLTYLYDYRTWYDIAAFTITNGAICGWIIYGFSIYYSDLNDCDKYAETSFFSSMMFVILFIGYIMIFVYIMMLCTVPCVYMFLRDGGQPQRGAGAGQGNGPNNRAMVQAQVPGIIASLSKTQYDPDKFVHDSDCVICMVPYKAKDIVTQLKCDPRHYFHTECLESWIKQGHNQCPYCRAPIENFANQSQSSNEDSIMEDNNEQQAINNQRQQLANNRANNNGQNNA